MIHLFPAKQKQNQKKAQTKTKANALGKEQAGVNKSKCSSVAEKFKGSTFLYKIKNIIELSRSEVLSSHNTYIYFLPLRKKPKTILDKLPIDAGA